MYIVNYTMEGQTKQKLINGLTSARSFARITRRNGYKVNYIENYKSGKKLTQIF